MMIMLNDNIVMLRNINGYSQEEVAEKIGISRHGPVIIGLN